MRRPRCCVHRIEHERCDLDALKWRCRDEQCTRLQVRHPIPVALPWKGAMARHCLSSMSGRLSPILFPGFITNMMRTIPRRVVEGWCRCPWLLLADPVIHGCRFCINKSSDKQMAQVRPTLKVPRIGSKNVLLTAHLHAILLDRCTGVPETQPWHCLASPGRVDTT